MNSSNKSIVTNFIQTIWNQQQFEQTENFISSDFIDHSLPPALPANKIGMLEWIIATGKSFEHTTIIEEMVCEGNKVMLKIKMLMKHTGVWRGIEPTHFEIATVGYRYYKITNGKIAEHWALIDGNAIENQLSLSDKGCKIQN